MADATAAAGITPGTWRWEFMGTAGRWMLVNDSHEFVRVGGWPGAPLSADKVLIAAAPVLLLALQDAQVRLAAIALLANGESEEIYNLAYDGEARRAIALATEVPAWTPS